MTVLLILVVEAVICCCCPTVDYLRSSQNPAECWSWWARPARQSCRRARSSQDHSLIWLAQPASGSSTRKGVSTDLPTCRPSAAVHSQCEGPSRSSLLSTPVGTAPRSGLAGWSVRQRHDESRRVIGPGTAGCDRPLYEFAGGLGRSLCGGENLADHEAVQ